MPFPNDSGTIPANMQGTTLLADAIDDHSLMHRQVGTILNALPTTLGTTAGTNILKNITSAGQFAVSVNSSNVLQQSLTGTLGMSAGSITGQISNTGTIANGVYGTATYQGGTANTLTLGTPSTDIIKARGTAIGFNNSIYPSEGSLTDSAGGTLTPDAGSYQMYYSVMGTSAGNRTIGTPTNPSSYQLLTLAFKASGSANGTIVWSSAFRISQDYGTPALGTGTSWNYFIWRYNAIDSKWDFNGQMLNLV